MEMKFQRVDRKPEGKTEDEIESHWGDRDREGETNDQERRRGDTNDQERRRVGRRQIWSWKQSWRLKRDRGRDNRLK